MARFEVAAHRYVDLSDNNSGMALLNDCKYGYRPDQSRLDLNLLRSPTYPDPEADLGAHHFTYALLPHDGTLPDSDVISQADQLNQPPLSFSGYACRPATALPCHLDANGIELAVLKRAERDDSLILRLVESRGKSSRGILTIPAAMRLVETDLMEWEAGDALAGTTHELELNPFEIRTYRLEPHVTE